MERKKKIGKKKDWKEERPQTRSGGIQQWIREWSSRIILPVKEKGLDGYCPDHDNSTPDNKTYQLTDPRTRHHKGNGAEITRGVYR